MEDCQQTLSELEMFLDGELPEDQQQRVLDHLRRCMECYHTYDLQAELRQIIAAKCAKEPLPPGLLDRIHQSLSNETA
jgi:mycothiol system anti-sigma-R factor